jgi:transcription-repair coupling factor (superfamily II helicase)
MNTAMIAFPVSKSWTPSQSGLEMVDTSLLAWVIEAVDQLTATSKASTT